MSLTGCYIIRSEKLNRFYIGATQVGYEQRILHHNQHEYGMHRYTAAANDWKIFIWMATNNINHAIRIEKKIKSMKSSKYIQNLKNYPELIEKILQETF